VGKTEGWRDILGDYSGVLLRSVQCTLYLEELLPHPPNVIKDAIIQGLKEIGNSDLKMKNHLQIAYVVLARFVSNEDFKIVKECESVLMQNMPKADPTQLTEEERKRMRAAMSQVSSDLRKKYSKIVKSSSEQSQMYADELKLRMKE